MLSPFSLVCLFAVPWIVVHQAPLSMGFSRQEYWIGLPCPPPRDLPNPGIKASSLMFLALAGGFFTTSATWEIPTLNTWMYVCMYVCFTIEENQPWCLLLSPLFRGCRYNWLISLSTTHSGKAQFTQLPYFLTKATKKREPLFPIPMSPLFNGPNKYVRFIGTSYAWTIRSAFRLTLYTEALSNMWPQFNLFLYTVNASLVIAFLFCCTKPS